MSTESFPTFFEGTPIWHCLTPDGRLSFVVDLQRRRQENSLERVKTRAVGRKATRQSMADPLTRALREALSNPKLLELLREKSK